MKYVDSVEPWESTDPKSITTSNIISDVTWKSSRIIIPTSQEKMRSHIWKAQKLQHLVLEECKIGKMIIIAEVGWWVQEGSLYYSFLVNNKKLSEGI